MSIRLASSLVAGAFLASRLERLPDLPELGALAVLALVCVLAGRRWRALSCVGALLASFCWAAGWGLTQLDRRLDSVLEGRDLDIVGVVAGLPVRIERGLRFDFEVERAPPGVPARIVLNWYGARGEQASLARPA